MNEITSAHFGGNIVLTNDSAAPESPYQQMLSQISFSNFRYPGGTVTENQTWENGGLQKIFGSPMAEDSPDYVMTIREALQICSDNDASISLVVPTFQFFDTSKSSFDNVGFNRYVDELREALSDYPDVQVSRFEIGNEFWSRISPEQYGQIANFQIPILNELNKDMSSQFSDWNAADIGLQSGAGWLSDGADQSHTIADQISMENRDMVDAVIQHAYPNPHRGMEWQKQWTMETAYAFKDIAGFGDDLEIAMSEFNIGIHAGSAPVYGVNQATIWIEEFSRYIDAGVDSFDHWGLNYNWLTTKFYDSQFAPAESDGGNITTIATPMGQVYDLASSNLIGMTTITDAEALSGIEAPMQINVTGFEGDEKKVVFLGNIDGAVANVNFSELTSEYHVVAHHIIPADAPSSTWYDETTNVLDHSGEIIDARGDMRVTSADGLDGTFQLNSSELLMLIISDRDSDLILEGAHAVTDPNSGMVNDYITGADGNDIIRGHVGDDTLNGGEGNDVLTGGSGKNVLLGGAGNDFLLSESSGDTLEGGDGDDILISSGLSDDSSTSMSGGGGKNLFVLGEIANVEITDFSEGDLISFGGLFETADDLSNATSVSGDDLVVQLADGKSLTLVGGADYADDLGGRVFDFASDEEVATVLDGFRENFNEDQHDEIFDIFRQLAQSQNHDAELWESYSWEDLPDGDPSPPQPDPEPQPEPQPEPEPQPNPDPDPKPEPEPEPVDPDEDVDDEDYSDRNESGGSCFVATAAYGDPWHPDVVDLRSFRDLHLIRFRAGRRFVRLYWIIGPRLARVTTAESFRGRAAKIILSGFVRVLRFCGLTT